MRENPMLSVLLALQIESLGGVDLLTAVLALALLALITAVAVSSRASTRRERDRYGRRGVVPEAASGPSRVVEPTTKTLGTESPLVWRQGRIVVMDATAELPHRCVRCNAPTERRLDRNLRHLPRWVLVLLPVPVLYALVGELLERKAAVTIGLCARHVRTHRLRVAGTVGVIFAGVGLIVLGASTPTPVGGAEDPFLYFFLAGATLILLGWWAHSNTHTILNATHIDHYVVEMRGASDAFLDSLERRAA